MKKLIYILHSIETGGVEVAVLSAIPKLVENFNLKIIVLGAIDEKLIKDLSAEQRKVFIQFNYNFFFYPFILPYIVYSILKLRPDIILSSLWRASLVGVIVKNLLGNVRYVAFIHSTYFPHKLDALFSKMAMRKSDLVLTDSKSTNSFVERFNRKVTVKTVSFLTINTPLIFHSLFDADYKEIRFMSLGRMNKVKNVPLAIEAIAYLRQQGLDVYLDIYGRDDGSQGDVNRAIEKNRMKSFIQMKGEVAPNDRFELFDHYHALIQLSSFEGMAMSVVEAMQHGLLCAITPVGEIPNYTIDMLSVVYMAIDNQNERLKSYERLRQVLINNELCKRITRQAQNTFKGKPLYSESLIDLLLN